MDSGATVAALVSIIGGILIAASGLIWGYIVLFAGIMLYYQPNHRLAWGVVVILLSVLGLVARAPAGLIGLVGGVAGVLSKSRPITSATEVVPQK